MKVKSFEVICSGKNHCHLRNDSCGYKKNVVLDFFFFILHSIELELGWLQLRMSYENIKESGQSA